MIDSAGLHDIIVSSLIQVSFVLACDLIPALLGWILVSCKTVLGYYAEKGVVKLIIVKVAIDLDWNKSVIMSALKKDKLQPISSAK